MKINKAVLAAVLVLGQLLPGCGVLPEEEEFQSAPVIREYEGANYGKTKAVRGDLIDSVNVKVQYQGTKVQELQHRDIRRVEKVYVKKGSKVKSGDILIRYYIDEEVQNYEEAEYNCKVAETQIRHQKELLAIELNKQKEVGADKKAIQDVEEAYRANITQMQSNLKIYRMEKQEAKKEIQQFDLKASASGTVTYVKPNMEGKLAKVDEAVITIEGEKKNFFMAITEYEEYFKEGMTVNVTILKNTYPVKVKKNSKTPKKVYFYLKNKSSNIDTGKFGTVVCILKQKKDVLYLPSSVVYEMDGKTVVYIEDDNGLKQALEVHKGTEFNHLTEIVSGLKEGDEVIAR